MASPHLDVAARQGGAIARRQLTEAGATARRVAGMVERGELRPVRRNVFVVAGAPPTWAQRAWVELLDNPPSAVLACRTAARLHRIGRFTVDAIDVTQPEEVVHRSVEASRRRSTRLPARHIVRADGFPTTSLARTVFDLCGLVSTLAEREASPTSRSRRWSVRSTMPSCVDSRSRPPTGCSPRWVGGAGRGPS